MFYGRNYTKAHSFKLFFCGRLASGEVGFFRLLKALFFIFIIFYDVVDDEKNDKPDEEGAEKTFNHQNVPQLRYFWALIKRLFHVWNI